MPSKAIMDYITQKMKDEGKDWNGMGARAEPSYKQPSDNKTLPRVPNGQPINEDVLRAWLKHVNNNWAEWAMRVRRDLLVIEKLVIPDDERRAWELYGDPGDPPIDPELI